MFCVLVDMNFELLLCKKIMYMYVVVMMIKLDIVDVLAKMFSECDTCEDDGGMCDHPYYLENGRCFSLTLKEGFKDFSVCNQCTTYFFLIKYDLRSFL